MNVEYKKGYEQALIDINIPKTVITEEYETSKCPRCNEGFHDYEKCNDGYCERAYSLERCTHCGQKIKW